MRESLSRRQRRFGAVLSAGSETAGDWAFARGLLEDADGCILAGSARTMLAAFATPDEALTCALRIGTAGQEYHIAIAQGEAAADGSPAAWPVVRLVENLRLAAPVGCIAMPEALHHRLRARLDGRAVTSGEPVMEQPVAIVKLATHGDASPPDPRITLGVVPFRPAGTMGADRIGDEVIRLLSSLPDWVAVMRAPAIQAWGTADLRRIRRACDARYLLHGAAEQEGTILRLTLELTELETGCVLWSDRMDQPIKADGSGWERCGARTANSVLPLLVRRETEQAACARRGRPTGQDMALQALAAVLQPEAKTFAQALESLHEAAAQPAPPASVLVALVAWHLMAASQGWVKYPEDALASAEAVARRLNPGTPAAAAMLAYLESGLHGNHALACALLDLALEQAPACPIAWTLKARVLVRMDRAAAAVSVMERASRLPSFGIDRAWRAASMALAYHAAERHADAAHWARVSAAHHPGLAMGGRILAASLAALGRLEEADKAAARVLAISPGFRLGAWRLRSNLPVALRERYSQRLRLAGLPE